MGQVGLEGRHGAGQHQVGKMEWPDGIEKLKQMFEQQEGHFQH